MLFDTVVLTQLKKLDVKSFNHEMDKLEQKAIDEGDYGVQLEVIMGRYDYTDRHDLSDYDEKIATMEKLLSELDRKRYPEYAALIMFDLGNNYFGKKHNYTLAFENYINTYNLVKKFSVAQFPDKKNILVYLASRYYNFGELEKARELLLMADTLPGSWVRVTNYNNKNTLGLICRNEEKYDSAISYFQRTYELAANDSDEVWSAIALGNIGITYYLAGDYEKAIPLLKKDVAGCLEYGVGAYDNAVNSLLILSEIYLNKGALKETAGNIGVIYKYLDSTRDKMKHQASFYPVLSEYYYQKGDVRKAYVMKDSAMIYKDSLAERDNIYKLAKVEYRKEIEKHHADIKRLNAEKKYIEFVRNGLVVGVILLFIIALLVVNRQRLKYILKQNKLLSEKKLTQQELTNASKQLESYTQRLQEKNALIEKSADEIERLQSTLSQTQQEQVNNDVLQQLYASTILTDEEWEEFKLLFEQVHRGFLQRLRDKMPGLSPADTRFLVLSKLKLTNKEMAGILGVQPDTIRSYKHRLKKKYDLPDDDNISDFVDAI